MKGRLHNTIVALILSILHCTTCNVLFSTATSNALKKTDSQCTEQLREILWLKDAMQQLLLCYAVSYMRCMQVRCMHM